MTASQHILCIDDHLDTCALISLVLAKHGYQVSAVTNAAEAIELIKTERIDLIVTDLYLADCGGIAHIEQLRYMQPDVPVVVLSGAGQSEVIKQVIAAGASDYLVKPLAIQDLPHHIARLLK